MMKIEKNKIVFGSVLGVVIVFIIAYAMFVFGGEGDKPVQLKQTLIPELEQEQQDYKSKLEAVDALKEVREKNAPSIYSEKFLDSLGFYDPGLPEKEKEKKVDSIYRLGRINYTENSYRSIPTIAEKEAKIPPQDSAAQNIQESVSARELGLEHLLFYSSKPTSNIEGIVMTSPEAFIKVEVDGEQVVQAGHRLKMRLTEAAVINNISVPENTAVYGFVRFQPNRALIEIENILHQPVKLKAYDLQDGSEGIYVENSLRAEVNREVVDDIIQDIDIPGFPQIGGIKQVFQKRNRNIKVQVINNYKLILKGQ